MLKNANDIFIFCKHNFEDKIYYDIMSVHIKIIQLMSNKA